MSVRIPLPFPNACHSIHLGIEMIRFLLGNHSSQHPNLRNQHKTTLYLCPRLVVGRIKSANYCLTAASHSNGRKMAEPETYSPERKVNHGGEGRSDILALNQESRIIRYCRDVQRCTKRWTCFAKQQPGTTRTDINLSQPRAHLLVKLRLSTSHFLFLIFKPVFEQ